MLIIDKKKMRLKDSGLPANVIAQTPKMLRRSKLPIVKAKVGPKVMTLICDGQIFDSVPVKKGNKYEEENSSSIVMPDTGIFSNWLWKRQEK